MEISWSALIIALDLEFYTGRAGEEPPGAQNNCVSRQQEERASWLQAKSFNWLSAGISAVAN